MRRFSACANGVSMSLPSTFANRSSVTATCGLSSAKSRRNASTSSSDRSTAVRAARVRCMSSRNTFGSWKFAPYTSAELFTTTLRTGLPGAPAAASRFIVPITLISCSVRPVARVESTMRCVCTTVSISVARTMRARIEYDESARTNSVRSSGTRGSLRVEPDDDLDVGPLLERLRDATTPVGAQAGDEDTHRGTPISRTTRCAACAACRRALLAPCAGCVRTPPSRGCASSAPGWRGRRSAPVAARGS